jgi:MFS family permease
MNSLPVAHGRPTHTRYLVLGALCSAAAIAYLSRNILGPAEKSIEQDLGLSKEAMGFVMGSFFYTYSLMQIPGGWLNDRLGTRLALPLLAAVWTVGTAVMGLAVGFYSLLFCYLLIGLAQGGLFPGTVITFSNWFPPSERGIAGGSLTSCMSLGGVVAAILVGRLLDPIGWRGISVLFALPAALWAAWFFAWFRNKPREHPAVNEAEVALIEVSDDTGEVDRPPTSDSPQQQSSTAVWSILLTTPSIWLIWGQQFFRAAGYVFFPTWFPRYLQETRGVTESQSADLTAVVLTSIVVGATVGGFIGDWTWRRTGSRRLSRQGVAIISTSACALAVYLAYLSASTTEAMAWMSLAAFMQAVAAPCAIATAIDVGGEHVSKVYSSMNMVGAIGAAVSPWAVAKFVTWNGERWDLVLLLFVGIYAASVFCWALLNPVRSLVRQAEP